MSITRPVNLQKPFADSGAKNTIPVASQIGITAGAASFTDGFPPLTMTPIAAGGVPPSGQDMNGALNILSQHTAFLGSGGAYQFDATLSTAMGGYAVGAVLQDDAGLNSYVNILAGNTTNFNSTPASIGVSWMPYAGNSMMGRAELSAPSGASLVGGSGQVVSSIVGLRALLKTSASKNAFVTGYYAAGDGGGGAYWYDSTDTTTVDNSGTVIVATDGARWKLVHYGIVSVAQFGATGTADDTASINAALSAIGIYHVTLLSGITHNVSGVVVPGNKTFDFNGGKLKQIAGTVNTSIVSVGDNVTRVNNVWILNLSIDGNKANVSGNSANGISIQKAQNVNLTSPIFDSVRRVGLYAYDVIGLRVYGLLTSTNGGVTGSALGNGIYSLNCTSIQMDSIYIATHSGVGGLFQGFFGLDIGYIEASGVVVDNGATFDTGSKLRIGGYKISACANQGLEINSMDGFEIGPGSSYNNGVYGILISTYTGGTEVSSKNGTISAPYTYGNAVNGLRIIGSKSIEIQNPNILDGMLVINSASGLTVDNIDIIDGSIYSLTLSSGLRITSKDTDISYLTNSGVSYTARATKSGVSSLPVTNGGTFDLKIPTVGALPFSGILVVASYYSANYAQNTTAAYLINTQGTATVTSMTVSSGGTVRQVAVTVIDNKTLRITNSTGVDCLVNAAFMAAL